MLEYYFYFIIYFTLYLRLNLNCIGGHKMSVLIVGGDHLGVSQRSLINSGERSSALNRQRWSKIRDGIPETMDFIIVLYDFVNHNLAHKIKSFAENRGIPVVYAKRSWSSIYQKIKRGSNNLKGRVGIYFKLDFL